MVSGRITVVSGRITVYLQGIWQDHCVPAGYLAGSLCTCRVSGRITVYLITKLSGKFNPSALIKIAG